MAHSSNESTGEPNPATSCLTGVGEEAAPPQGTHATSALSYDLTSKLVLIAGLVLLVIACFSTSLSGKFVLDDRPQILDNKSLDSWDQETMRRVLTRDVWAVLRPELARDRLDSVYYRPIFSLFLKVGHEIAGRNAFAWHLLAVLLHCLTVVAVFLTAERSLQGPDLSPKKRRLLAAFAAAVFAVHPVQVETVAWISGLVGPLSAIFLLSAFHFYVVYRERASMKSLAASLLLFAFALLTKENTLALLLIIAAYEIVIFRGARLEAKVVLRLAPYLLTAIGYFALRYSLLNVVLGRSMNANFPDDASLTLADNLRTLPLLIANYAKLVVFPFYVSLEYDVGYVFSLGLASFWLPLAIVIGIAILLVYCWRRIPESKAGIIWIVLPLLPHFNTRSFVSEELLHDRYLYLSMFGVGLLAATLIGRIRPTRFLPRPDRALITAGIGLVLVLGGITAVQNRNWQNEDDLWNHSARFAPNSRIVRIALGGRAEQRQDYEAALRYYESALAINPDIIDALNNSALLYARLGRWEEATSRFEHIVSLTPNKAMAHFNLSFAYGVQKRLAAAADELRIAIELDPHGPRADEWRVRLDQLEKAVALQSGDAPRAY